MVKALIIDQLEDKSVSATIEDIAEGRAKAKAYTEKGHMLESRTLYRDGHDATPYQS